ncbi:MAG: hypothetical protein M3Z24_03825 [Chloroflexota bacterium]|nr:hypothetical protein [Chloroflexota bacterium]
MFQCLTVDAELESSFIGSATPITDVFPGENCFATAPMQAIPPLFQQLNEAELLTDFEQAISDRVLAVNQQLARISGPLPQLERIYKNTEQLRSEPEQPIPSFSGRLGEVWQRNILFACFALMFILVGFDLMGLLVLHIH